MHLQLLLHHTAMKFSKAKQSLSFQQNIKHLLGMQAYYYKFFINVNLVIEGELSVETLNTDYHCKAAHGITASHMEVLKGFTAYLRLQGDGHSKISHIK